MFLFKYQYLQMFCLKLNKIMSDFHSLEVVVAIARHNVKCVKIKKNQVT